MCFKSAAYVLQARTPELAGKALSPPCQAATYNSVLVLTCLYAIAALVSHATALRTAATCTTGSLWPSSLTNTPVQLRASV